jgi:hypothetical protein
MRWLTTTALLAGLALVPLAPASADDEVATLTLDGLSFVSFGDERLLSLPSGSTIEFHFGPAAADGSRSFTIPASGVSIAPIALGGDEGSLAYSLATTAAGILRPSAEGGKRMDFTASVEARRTTSEGEGSYRYTLPFTTETAEARDLTGSVQVEIQGMRLVDGLWYVQLVGGVTNKSDAVPEAGTAVYTLLSGRFDRMP